MRLPDDRMLLQKPLKRSPVLIAIAFSGSNIDNQYWLKSCAARASAAKISNCLCQELVICLTIRHCLRVLVLARHSKCSIAVGAGVLYRALIRPFTQIMKFLSDAANARIFPPVLRTGLPIPARMSVQRLKFKPEIFQVKTIFVARKIVTVVSNPIIEINHV